MESNFRFRPQTSHTENSRSGRPRQRTHRPRSTQHRKPHLERLEDRLCLSVTLVTSRTALAGTDYVDWGVLGPSNTTVANPFTVTSAGGVRLGVSARVNSSSFSTMEETPVTDGATAPLQMNFAAGDHLLWLGTPKGLQIHKSNPITFDFGASAVQGGGAQIGSAVYGNFVARVEAFNASGVSLASFTEAGNAQNTNGDNSAIFIGVRSDTANISRIALSIDSAPLNKTAQFVISRFDFRTAEVARTTAAAPGTNALTAPRLASADSLYIGDNSDNSVKQFDAKTGAYLGTLVAPGSGGLAGPRGLILRNGGQLLAVNQNVNLDVNGEILRYNANTGAGLGPLVPASDPNAPFAPRGMVMDDKVIYVANLQDNTDGTTNGEVKAYKASNGKFLGDLTPTGLSGKFNPRAVVFGPDGGLYVSAFDTTNPLVGNILEFDTTTGSYRVVAFNNGDGIADPGETQDLHRPEGLTFGPDGNLYVTSFRANASDTDKILELNGTTGQLQHEIVLDSVGGDRAFGQAIAFGPGGALFVPISGNGTDTGAVRRYDVTNDSYTNFVAPGGPLGSPWYLTFGKTDPATLAYQTKHGDESGMDTPSSLTQAGSRIAGLDPLLIGSYVDQALTQADRIHPARHRSAR
jgi:hypothetical protein